MGSFSRVRLRRRAGSARPNPSRGECFPGRRHRRRRLRGRERSKVRDYEASGPTQGAGEAAGAAPAGGRTTTSRADRGTAPDAPLRDDESLPSGSACEAALEPDPAIRANDPTEAAAPAGPTAAVASADEEALTRTRRGGALTQRQSTTSGRCGPRPSRPRGPCARRRARGSCSGPAPKAISSDLLGPRRGRLYLRWPNFRHPRLGRRIRTGSLLKMLCTYGPYSGSSGSWSDDCSSQSSADDVSSAPTAR